MKRERSAGSFQKRNATKRKSGGRFIFRQWRGGWCGADCPKETIRCSQLFLVTLLSKLNGSGTHSLKALLLTNSTQLSVCLCPPTSAHKQLGSLHGAKHWSRSLELHARGHRSGCHWLYVGVMWREASHGIYTACQTDTTCWCWISAILCSVGLHGSCKQVQLLKTRFVGGRQSPYI